MDENQYHFRPSQNGFYAWRISKLIELTKGVTPTEIPLDEIVELDEPYWFGAPGNIPTCRLIAGHAEQIEEVELEYPIIMCPDKRIMDGMHRVAKALILGKQSIAAYILPSMPEPDYEDVDPNDFED